MWEELKEQLMLTKEISLSCTLTRYPINILLSSRCPYAHKQAPYLTLYHSIQLKKPSFYDELTAAPVTLSNITNNIQVDFILCLTCYVTEL